MLTRIRFSWYRVHTKVKEMMGMTERRFTVALTEDEHAAVKREAREQGRSVRRQVQYIVRKWIQGSREQADMEGRLAAGR